LFGILFYKCNKNDADNKIVSAMLPGKYMLTGILQSRLRSGKRITPGNRINNELLFINLALVRLE